MVKFLSLLKLGTLHETSEKIVSSSRKVSQGQNISKNSLLFKKSYVL